LVAVPNLAELAHTGQAQLQAANALQNEKAQAWAAFYTAPASCEHPVDWDAQVECGNRYMRAKKLFEQAWEAEHPQKQGSATEIVLDNGSVGGPRRQ
jgi:hypothetical protein